MAHHDAGLAPEQAQPAARAKGAERYDAFVEALGRRLSKGPTLLREVSLDVAASGGSRAAENHANDRTDI